MTVSSVASAAFDDVAKAAKAYRQAQQAELSEEFALAADLYALADELSPSAPALRGAMRMSLSAERWPVAAGYAVEIVRRYPDDPTNAKLARATLKRTRPLLVAVDVDCGPQDCDVLVDEKVASPSRRRQHEIFVRPGTRYIAGGYEDGTSRVVLVNESAGGSAQVVLVPPDPPKEPETPVTLSPSGRVDDGGSSGKPPKRRRLARLSPWWFGVGAVSTVAVSAGAVVSGLAARRAGDDFREGGFTRPLYDDATRLEVRTNILLGVAVGLGVTTSVLAIFTDWKRRGRNSNRAKRRTAPRLTTSGLSVRF